MYIYRNRQPLTGRFNADESLELLMTAGIDGALGESWADDNGAIVATGFFTYLFGKPTPGEELDSILRQACPCCVVPKSPGWLEYLKKYRYRSYTRYKMSPPARADIIKLTSFIRSLPEGFSVHPIDSNMLESGVVTEQELNISHVFGSRESYLRNGFGFAVLDGSRAVSVVSSYIVYNGEAEVDIATAMEYRRHGLASAVCARFMLECISRNITPSWDAQNMESVKLAEKLGFVFDHEYHAYVLEL